MRESVKITIITAAYNAARTIEQTISSVVHQDYPNIEYIIIDGGSTDGTVSVIKRYASIYDIKWVSEVDHGLYDALNKGVRMATGDYVEIIGADDALVSKDVISRVVSEMHVDIDIFAGQAWFVDEASKKQGVHSNITMRDSSTYQGGMSPHAAMFVRREILLQYPFDTSYRIAGDYKFFLQCYYDDNVRIQYSNEMIAFFALSGLSSNATGIWKEEVRLYRELGLPFRSYDSAYSSWIVRIIKYALFSVHLLVPARMLWQIINIQFRWRKHTCSNNICRWCNRNLDAVSTRKDMEI